MTGISLTDFWRPDFFSQLAVFLSLTVRGLGLGLLISIPLGIVLTRLPRLAGPVIYVLALVQTIPSLALLGFFISVFYLFGAVAAVTAAVVYSIFPIVLNTYTGITQVDPKIRDAARGMGMTGWQILWKIELPLALPVMMAGINSGAIYAIGVITICSLAGAGGLGDYIVRGVTMGDAPLILLGVVPILVLTMFFFWGLNSLGDVARKHGQSGLILCGFLVLLMAGYAVGEPAIQTLVQSGAPIEQQEQSSEKFRQRSWGEVWEATPDIWQQTVHFLSLTVRGLGLALLLGIPFGIVLTRFPRFSSPLISGLGLLQTVPSLALLGFCISVPLLVQDTLHHSFAVETNLSFLIPFGSSAVVFATVVYCLFPIVLNTFTGIVQVDPRVRDAARGMGMTGRQILWNVELPLALPVVMAGVRTAAAYAIALVTVGGVLGGARGLGEFVISGIGRKDNDLVLMGMIPIFIISLAVFWALSGIAQLRRIRASLGQWVAVGLILLMSGYAVAAPFFQRPADVRIGGKNFTENLILAHILKLMIEEHTDLKVGFYPNLGSNYAFKALRANHLDMYPEYTGTMLAYKDALHDSPASAIEKARKMGLAKPSMTRSEILTSYVRHEMKKRFDLIFLKTFGLNNTYAVLVYPSVAEKYDLRTIGDLKKVPQFRVIVDQEFKDRPDGWKGLIKTYDLYFNNPPRQFDPNLLYRSLKAGNAEVVIGFATDWQISTEHLKTLKDDKHYFPSYHAAPLVRWDTLRRHPEIADVLNKLAGRINDKTARELSRQVVKEKRWAEDVAREFLRQEGLLRKGK